TRTNGSAPIIGGVSPAQTINGTTGAILSATGVTSSDGIARVWAVIRPPDFSPGPSDNPVQGLPSIDLKPLDNNRYENTYTGFNVKGTYQVAIYAMDRIGNTCVPKLTTVSVENPLRRKAIIVAGGPETDPLWPAVQKSAGQAFDSLTFQGYTKDDIYFLSPVSFSSGVSGLPSISNISYAIQTWAKQNTQDLVIYLVGTGQKGSFQLSLKESLAATDLKVWLDNLQSTISGKVAVIYDACLSGSFIPLLTPPQGKERIVITSTAGNEAANFLSQGDISFSKFFWGKVANGANVRDAFLVASQAVNFLGRGQTPYLDDNGNGIGNEKADGALARGYTIGGGIMLAADNPMIGTGSPEQTISGPSAVIWAKDVTTTGTIDQVWAIITPPNYSPQPSDPVIDLPMLVLNPAGGGMYQGMYNDFSLPGRYIVNVFAKDTKNLISNSLATTVIQSGGSANSVNGIWTGANGAKLYLQAYDKNDAMCLLSKDGRNIIAFYDEKLENNVFEGGDIHSGGKSYRIKINFASPTQGSYTLTNQNTGKGQSDSLTIFPKAEVNITTDGIWQATPDTSQKFYFQRYTGGGALLLLSNDGVKCEVFYDKSATSSLFSGWDIYGQGINASFSFSGAVSGQVSRATSDGNKTTWSVNKLSSAK
ncbi:MAG: hypothetical protein HQK60_02195, partial [Deltaproteobacteria bacterium]|nr:hypothetical protein [Deltaproteobacteria bacterium]